MRAPMLEILGAAVTTPARNHVANNAQGLNPVTSIHERNPNRAP